MAAALGGLKKHTEVATLVWDGAPSHWDQWVRELGMALIGLPPYTPELNPAERGRRCGGLLRERCTPL